MVSVFLKGGLGNYMFQIATAVAYGLEYDEEVVVSKDTVTVHKHVSEYYGNILRKVKFIEADKIKIYNKYDEPTFSYKKIPHFKECLLVGYFQSEKYFKKYRNHILDYFSITNEEKSYIIKKYGNLLVDDITSIHIRRGDYIKLTQHHPPCTMKYYNKAMSKMPINTKYLVFSDDIAWCKEMFKGKNFTFIEGENDVIDLHLMSLCNNNIIANSSFSWWAAWLNQNENKIITIPSKWFGPAKGDIPTADIYPDGWIKI